MQQTGVCKRLLSKALVFVLAVALVFTMMPLANRSVSYAANELTVKTPVLVATGTDLVGDYKSADGVSKEKSWTLDELKALDGVQGEMYSAKQQQYPYTKSYNLVDGVKVSSLIGDLSQYTDVAFVASDKYAVTFKSNAEEYNYENPGTKNVAGLASGRYYYDGFTTASPTKEVPVVIGWAFGRTEGTEGAAPTDKPTSTADKDFLRLFCGQLASPGLGAEDMNGQLFNGKDSSATMQKIIAGDAIEETVLTVGSKSYTRADLLMMDFAERSYTYSTKSGETTDAVRGIPFSVLLEGEDDDATVTFAAADGYDMSGATKTVKQLVDSNYMLAYQVNGKGVYEKAKSNAPNPDGYGYLTLYGDGDKPAKMVNKVTVTKEGGIDFSASPYKHITNGGIEGQDGPYKIDAITGATLTIEGPGMTTSTPLSVKDLESKDKGCARGDYTDTRNGEAVTRTYEGIDLYYLLTGMNKDGIKLTDKAYKVTVKNRNRQSIATLTLDDVKAMSEAGHPALVAYGTSYTDGTNIRPFVFDGATGRDAALGNEDGCLKFVYDLDTYGDQDGKYTKFGNMAYVYVEEENTPGFKHDKEPYNTAENSQYVLTVTGDEIGCEINYTVEQLEDLVKYDENGDIIDNGYGYRDEYSLANSSYWYVNSYEGVKLWSLLQHSGIDAARATDSETKVTFRATDNYTGFDTFSLEEIANPDLFGFYEKNANDNNDGTYEPNENIREGDDVTTGDKLRAGFPVLVSYGVNNYPYVIDKSLDGYLSGLSNDGGPLRIISGKRTYNHANGSNQAKLLDKIVVGDNTYNYSTHSYQPADAAYKALETSPLKVVINDGAKETTKDYTVKDLEELLYGGNLTKTQLAEAKVKAFYEVGKNGNFYSDLYEGVNLNYFLTDVVELAGSQGTITFKPASGDPIVMDLEDVLKLKDGYNAATKLGGLSPVIAYAKNGYPLVEGKDSAGYLKNQTLKGIAEGEEDSTYTVQNNGGPLQLVFPRADASAEATLGSLSNIVEIDVDLEADKYAHISEPYDTYQANTLTVSGEGTRLTGEKTFTVSDLEGKQNLVSTKTYSLQGKSGDPTQQRFRGLSLYDFLRSTNVGLKSNADKVLIYSADSEQPTEFTLSQIRKADYINTVTEDADLPVMLAYGSSAFDKEDVKDGLPLVTDKTSAGYNEAYANDGGPLKLVIGQTEAGDANKSKCIKNVVKIEVTASEQVSWNHSSSEVFKSYLDDTVAFSVVDKEGNKVADKTYTVEELEAMTDIISQEDIYAVSQNTWEGLNFWQLIQKTFSDVAGIDDPITITVLAKDGYSADVVEKVGLDGLKNGVKDGENYVPVLLAYALDGYPLASGGKGAGSVMGEGYDSAIDNKGGPMRLMVHNAQGACIMEVVGITIKVGEAEPAQDADFTVASNTFAKDKTFSIAQLKELGAVEKEYTSKGVTDKVRGVPMTDLLASLDITDDEATFRIDAGGYGGEGTYEGITLKDAAAQDYLVAYEVFNETSGEWEAINDTNKTPNSKVRIYRNYPNTPEDKWYNKCQFLTGITVSVPERTVFDTYEGTSQPGQLPLAGIRATAMDKDGNVWIGTYGGGASFKAKGSDTFVTYNKASEPALASAVVSSVCPDDQGGVYMTQNASYTDGTANGGLAYMKDGKVTYFRASDDPKTVPNDYVQEIKIDGDGNVWLGSFGGLTKYDPKAGTWQTWDNNDGFPAKSVDNIEFDADGGIWCGFYPSSDADDGSAPFVGGFAYFKDGKVQKSYQYTSPADANTGQYRLGDVWVRDIAVDKKGGAWIVASGSYGGMANTGGKVYYVSAPGAEAQEYTGFDLFGEDSFTKDSELRMVTVDPDGGLWFGSSKDGVFYAADPTIIEGKLTLTAQYSSKTKSWSDKFNNVYSLDFHGNTLYVGTAEGLATHEFEFEGGEEPAVEPAGDATPEDAALTVTGDALARDGYFSIKGIKNAEGIVKTDATFNWQNSSGSTGTSTVQGATLENIFKDVIGMAEGAEIDSVELVSADGRTMTYTAKQALETDLAGNKAMFIWTEGADKVQKVIVGQFAEGEVNRSLWAKDVTKIIVHKKAEEPAVEPAGDATPEDAALTITGSALARDGYFSIKGIKNAEGIVKTDATFNWQNSSGSTGTSTVQGATLENIFKDVIGMAEGAEIDSVELVSADGKTMTYTADQALKEDLQGNKAMFIWTEGADKVQKVIVGQFEEGQVNKGKWAKDVIKIVVNKKVAPSEEELIEEVVEAIDELPAVDEITIDSADAIIAAREAYNALSDEAKAAVANYDALVAAEAALDNAIKSGYVQKGEELIDGVDFTDYSAANATGLWINLTRLESKLAKAESAAEAAELYQQMEDAVANTTTLMQTTLENLNEFPVEVTAKSASYNKISLSWHKLTSARSYTIYRSDAPDGEFKEIAKIQRYEYVDTGLKTGKKYYYVVVPGAKVKGEYVYGNPSEMASAAPKLAAPKVTAKAGKKKATITWKKVAGANGYVVYRSTKKSSGFKAVKTIKSAKTLKLVNKKLKANKTYYYKVKAYRTVDGKKVYSKFSAVKKVKVKK